MRWLIAVVCTMLLTACGGSGHKSQRTAATSSSSTPPSSTVATTTTSPTTSYVVKRGDTLSAIAHRFHVAVSAIESENHLANPDVLAEGATLRIPHAPQVKLAVAPALGRRGGVFTIHLTGAVPSEQVTFKIDSPSGHFAGAPHVANDSGSVTTSYQTASTDPTGPYTVTAHGDQGTDVKDTFVVTAS